MPLSFPTVHHETGQGYQESWALAGIKWRSYSAPGKEMFQQLNIQLQTTWTEAAAQEREQNHFPVEFKTVNLLMSTIHWTLYEAPGIHQRIRLGPSLEGFQVNREKDIQTITRLCDTEQELMEKDEKASTRSTWHLMTHKSFESISFFIDLFQVSSDLNLFANWPSSLLALFPTSYPPLCHQVYSYKI